MSEMENREENFRYDSMSTEELQGILRKHTHGELETELDTQELFEIMEVLSVRRQQSESQAFRSDEEAYAEFCEHYMPKEKKKDRSKVIRFPNRVLKTVAAALAVVLIFAVGTSVTAEALHIDIWGMFASWTKEIFHFSDVPQDTTAPEPEKENNLELKTLKDALAQQNISERIVPDWLPEGYVYKDLTVKNSPKARIIHAVFEKNELELIIKLRQIIGGQADQVEKSDDLVEVYTVNGVEYYIFSNNANLQAVWSIGEFECLIIGDISIEEMKAMIDSI